MSHDSRGKSSWMSRGLLVAAILLAIVVRIRLASMPLERDEGEYAYMGQLILRGIPPYRSACNMKLPGTYVAYAGIMAIFGQTATGIRLGVLLVNLATILLVFRFTAKVFDGFAAGIAAVAFSLMSISSGVLGMSGHATHFVVLFGTWGTVVLWAAIHSGRRSLALASGLLLGIAFVMKQPGIFFAVFGIVALLVAEIFRNDRVPRRLFQNVVLLASGIVLPYGLVCLWLYRAGVWAEFYFWTMTYAGHYARMVPYRVALTLFSESLAGILAANWPLWLLAFVGLSSVLRAQNVSAGTRLFATGWLIASVACIVPGLYFRPHYFIAILPALSMFAGVGASTLCHPDDNSFVLRFWTALWKPNRPLNDYETQPADNPGEIRKAPVFQFLASAIVMSSLAIPLLLQSSDLFTTAPPKLCRKIYGLDPFPEVPEIARYLREHSDPTDRIAIIGSEPELLFESQRDSATAYIYTYSLVEPQPLARRMQDEMIAQIEQSHPKFVVAINLPTSWLIKNDEKQIFQWAAKYTATQYRRIGIVDLFLDHTNFRWEDSAMTSAPRSRLNIQIYQRL